MTEKEQWFEINKESIWAFCDWCGKLEKVITIFNNPKWNIIKCRRKCPLCSKNIKE